MKYFYSILFASLALNVAAYAQSQSLPPSSTKSEKSNTASSKSVSSQNIGSAQQTLDDIKKTMGFVPQFFTQISDAALPGFWAQMKGLQMNSETALSAKEKELIGLAVAAQVPCKYCTYFHTQAAKANGATDAEIREAIAMAALTRDASTLLNGAQVDEAQFRRDANRAIKPAVKQRQMGGQAASDSSSDSVANSAASSSESNQ